MRRIIHPFAVAAAIVLACWTARPESTNAILKLFVLSDQKIDGGRFVDSPAFPKVGYISAEPEMTITNLQDVYRPAAGYDIMGDTNGNYTSEPSHPLPALAIRLRDEDAKRFAALTEKSIGKRILIMMDDHPLAAPKVVEKIEDGIFQITIRDPAELKRTEADLTKLIR